MSADQFVQYLVVGLTNGSIYALVGLGFTIIYSVTRIINFAQGEFVMLGGMLYWTLAVSAGIPLPLAVILAVIGAAATGAIMHSLTIRTAKKASVVSLIIITIGAAVFIRGIAAVGWDVDYHRPPYFTGNESVEFLGAWVHLQALWIIGITIIVTVLLHLFLSYTMLGKALKACAISPAGAGMVGINPRTMALIAFMLAAILGGIAGAVTAPKMLTAYDVGFWLGLNGFVAASIGGFKSPIITVVGGVALGVVVELSIGVDWGPFTSSYKDAIAMTALLLILLARSGRLAEEERTS